MLSVWSDTDLDITRQRSLYISTSNISTSSLHISNTRTSITQETNVNHQKVQQWKNIFPSPCGGWVVPCPVELEEYEHVCGCASLFVIWIINDRNYFCLVQISVSHSSCWELYYCERECDWHLQCYTDNIRGISLYNIALLDTSPVHSQDNHNTEYFRNILQKY